MKIQLSLFALFAVVSGNINAEGIRERLQREKLAAVTQVEKAAKELEPMLLKLGMDGAPHGTINKDLEKKLKEKTFATYPLALRAALLDRMIDCMDKHRNPDETKMVNKCFDKVNHYLETTTYINDKEKEMTQKEMKKIEEKDLRRSWFWWFK